MFGPHNRADGRGEVGGGHLTAQQNLVAVLNFNLTVQE
jgi:hypothetical protein